MCIRDSPDTANIQSEISFIENFLFKIQNEKTHQGYDSRLDSLEMKVIEASQVSGRWYFDLSKYSVENFLNEKTDEAKIEMQLKRVPIFLKSAEQTLRLENFALLPKHIERQTQSYFFIKKLSEKYPEAAASACFAIKNHIAFLNSSQKNQFSLEKVKKSR